MIKFSVALLFVFLVSAVGLSACPGKEKISENPVEFEGTLNK